MERCFGVTLGRLRIATLNSSGIAEVTNSALLINENSPDFAFEVSASGHSNSSAVNEDLSSPDPFFQLLEPMNEARAGRIKFLTRRCSSAWIVVTFSREEVERELYIPINFKIGNRA